MEKYRINEGVLSNNIWIKSKPKNGNKSEAVHLKPMDATDKIHGSFQAFEGKFPYKLNPLINIPSNRKFTSKIPVLQKSHLCKIEKINKFPLDNILSAADRRQKFQQSHHRVIPKYNGNSITPLQGREIYKGFMTLYNVNIANDAVIPATQIYHKTVLPPIKTKTDAEIERNSSTSKKKCLLGEITHFPALCNTLSKSGQKNGTSIPHLPYIFPFPNAPPPSVSNSFEK